MNKLITELEKRKLQKVSSSRYKDKTRFKTLLGYGIEIKILELLIEGKNEEYSFNDIVNALNTNRRRTYILLKGLVVEDILIQTKRAKHIRLWRINKKNKIVKRLISLYDEVIQDGK